MNTNTMEQNVEAVKATTDLKISDVDRAAILVEALPYIQKYSGETVVVKYGGNAMINEELKESMMRDIVLMQSVGINVVLVHGGGPEINRMLERLNIESKFINGFRYTDEETMEVVQEVLAGKVNKDLVQLLQHCGGKAIGLCGLDGGMLYAGKKEGPNGEDLGCVGEIINVNTEVIQNAIDNGYVPIIATVAYGLPNKKYNINADIAASKIAAELGARKLILMTDIKGLLRDKDDESTLIPGVNVSEVPALERQGIISGGMIPKVECCVEAIRRGVHRAHILDGRLPNCILIELFCDEGCGTMFY